MRGSPATGRGDGRRGVSELVSLVILFGLVVSGAAILAAGWWEIGAGFETKIQVESAEMTLEEFDSQIADVASKSGPRSGAVDLANWEGDGERVTVERSDKLHVWVKNDSGYVSECQATVPLHEVRYRVNEETTVVYQAGGVFRETGGVAENTHAPDIGFSDGTLNLWVVKLPNNVTGDEFDAVQDLQASTQATDELREDLFDGKGCQRPDGLKLVIETDRTGAWAGYLQDETPGSAAVSVDSAAGEVTVELGQDALVEAADDGENQVVGFNTSELPGQVTETAHSVGITVDKPDDTNSYGVSTKLLGAGVGHNQLSVSTQETEIDASLLQRAANRSEELKLITVDNSGKTIGTADIDVTEYVGSGAVIAGVPASILERNDPVETDVKGNTCTNTHGVQKPTTGTGHATWVVWNHCGTWKEYNVQSGEPVIFQASTDSALLDNAEFELQEKQGGDWTTVYNHTDALGNDDDRSFMFTPESNKVRVKNAGGQGFYMHMYGGLPDVKIKAVNATVDTQRIVHEPAVLRYRVGSGGWEWMVSGASPVYRAVNYADYVVTTPTLPDGETLETTASFYGCPDHDDQTDTPVKTGDSLPGDAFDDDLNLKPVYKNDPKYYDHYECEQTSTSGLPADANGYERGDSVSAAVGDQPPEWQSEFEEMVAPHTADIDGDGDEEFALDSNQVIVAFSYDDDGDGATEANNAVLLYSVGEPSSVGDGVGIDVTVDVVEFEN